MKKSAKVILCVILFFVLCGASSLIYYYGLQNSTSKEQPVTPVTPSDWKEITWEGLDDFEIKHIWTDGTNCYYSNGYYEQYTLNKSTNTWEKKTWNKTIYGENVWTDGENIYYSLAGFQYVLNKETSTWEEKTWEGISNLDGDGIYSVGEDIYCTLGNVGKIDPTTGTFIIETPAGTLVLDKTTDTWIRKSWNIEDGIVSFSGDNVWTDGENIYYSLGSAQYILNKETSTWKEKTWNGFANVWGANVWTDGVEIYYSAGTNQYILNKETSEWEEKVWTGLAEFNGQYVWTDGTNYYYSYLTDQYTLVQGER